MNATDSFSREVKMAYNLQKKHAFKKRTGDADGYYQLRFDDSLDNDLAALHALYQADQPFKIFGLHTNLYITDRGYDGLFVDISPRQATITSDGDGVFTVTSNVTVAQFVKTTMKQGYDFAAYTGVPGFIGSGVVGNSNWSASGKDFHDFVQKIVVYDFETGATADLVPDDSFFSDRDSFLKQQNLDKTRYFVKQVVLKLDHTGEAAVRAKFDAQMGERKESLRLGFKEGSAGALWSNAHLRKQTGKTFTQMLKENPSIVADYHGATYSPRGSMFFITQPDTHDADVAQLFAHTLTTVKQLYGIDLHKEVILLDHDGEIDLATFLDRYLVAEPTA